MGIDLESEDERVYKWGPPVILDEVMCFVYMLVHGYTGIQEVVKFYLPRQNREAST